MTGGLGFIGSNYIEHRLKAHPKDEILNIDRESTASDHENLSCEQDSRYSFQKKDLNELTELKADLLVNFAAETHVDRSIDNPAPFRHSNLDGYASLLQASRNGRVGRIIQISTDEVYGTSFGYNTEEDPLHPSNPYAAFKAAAEMLSMAYHRTYGLPIVTVRMVNNYGPHQYPEKIIPKTIILGAKNHEITLHAGGKMRRHTIYVEDACRAIDRVSEYGQDGEVYNVATDIEVEIRELVEHILDKMDSTSEIVAVPDRKGQDYRYGLDWSRLRDLGWYPKYSLDEGLDRTINWFRDRVAKYWDYALRSEARAKAHPA